MTEKMSGAAGAEASERKPGIEETFEALEATIKKLEDGESTLEESFTFYEEGMKLVKSLNTQIDQVEKQIQILSEGEEYE